jgi:pimeloyl-ACP methyl ester carboxylesterase
MHRWLAPPGCHLVYLRDLGRAAYANGIASLGTGIPAAIAGLGTVVRSLGVRRVFCFGNSAGGYGALRYAPALGANRVLALSPPTAGPQVIADSRSRHVPAHLYPYDDLVPLYRAIASPPRVHIVFGGASADDRRHAERMAVLPEVTVEELAGWNSHDIVKGLVLAGRLEATLRHLSAHPARPEPVTTQAAVRPGGAP